MIGQKLIEAAGNGISTGDVAEAIDFDGTNDYLSRASDLTGNADGGTFTFSAWVWRGNQNLQYVYNSCSSSTSTRFSVELTGTAGANSVRVIGKNTSGSTVFSATSTLTIPIFTWVSVIVSGNQSTNVLDVAVQDVSERISDSFTSTAAIDFTNPIHNVALFNTDEMSTRLSNVYLDYTYRDLSVTNNRRLFVTADLKPADGQASLNPILYLPMDDPTQPGRNDGTGGDFTLTGTVARSGRGPNQYNAPYSTFDGTADYLNKAASALGTDSYQVAFSCSFNYTSASTQVLMARGNPTAGDDNQIRIRLSSAGGASILFAYGTNSSQSPQVSISIPSGVFTVNRNYVLTFSFDSQNSAKRWVYINGVDYTSTVTWTTYLATSILNFSYSLFNTTVGSSGTSLYFNGRIGALWFNNSYIDLSVAANLAKFVTGTGIDAKPVDLGANGELPTGTSPLIYLPMYGNNAGKNYGTGGNFTVNSGPYTGARGPNEFWGNWADFVPNDYLVKSGALSGVADGKTFSFSVWVRPDTLTVSRTVFCFYNGAALRFELRFSSTQLVITARNSSNTTILQAFSGTVFATATQYCIQACIDLSNTSNRKLYVNGVLDTTSWSTYTNSDISFTSSTYEAIGASYAGSSSDEFDGKIGELYWTTDYIDFSQESNRLKFRDAFGNPVDLTQQIEDAAIPNPAIYMRFDPSSFGTNSGTGGNFTVTATPLDGGQF